MPPTGPAESGNESENDPSGDPADRFETVIGATTSERQLIDGAYEIARRGQPQPDHQRYELDLAALDDRLGVLAATCPGDPVTSGGVMSYLFRPDGGFAGNAEDYYNAENSYLNRVIERRLGIPITLAVIAIEVARRCDVTMVGVAMPGHFMVGLAGAAHYFDPFNGGVDCTVDQCRERFREMAGPDAPFLESYLEPVPAPMILWRMLNNLEGIAQRRKDAAMLAWVLQFKARYPDSGPEVGHRAAVLFKNSGQYLVAAKELERLIAQAGSEVSEKSIEDLQSKARRLRARLN